MPMHAFGVHSPIIYPPSSNTLFQLCVMLSFCVIEISIVNFQITTHYIHTLQPASEMAVTLVLVKRVCKVSYQRDNLIFTVPSLTWSRIKWRSTSMCFVCWDAHVLSDDNISQKLSTCTVIGYRTTAPINNKIAQINSISKHTSMIAKYSASVMDSVTVFSLCELQAMTDQRIRTMYPITISKCHYILRSLRYYNHVVTMVH